MTKPDVSRSMMQELWVFETRPAGIFVLIEEIGGQGEMGPFARMEDARSALGSYLGSHPDLPDIIPSRRVLGSGEVE